MTINGMLSKITVNREATCRQGGSLSPYGSPGEKSSKPIQAYPSQTHPQLPEYPSIHKSKKPSKYISLGGRYEAQVSEIIEKQYFKSSGFYLNPEKRERVIPPWHQQVRSSELALREPVDTFFVIKKFSREKDEL